MTNTTNTAAASAKSPRKPTGKLAFAYNTIMRLESQVAELKAALDAPAQPVAPAQESTPAAFEEWVATEQPAGCISDMKRGWEAHAALAAAAQASVTHSGEGMRCADCGSCVLEAIQEDIHSEPAAPAQAGEYPELPQGGA